MVPILLGRIQTRLFVVFTVGLLWTLALGALCMLLLGYMLNGWLMSYERQKLLDAAKLRDEEQQRQNADDEPKQKAEQQQSSQAAEQEQKKRIADEIRERIKREEAEIAQPFEAGQPISIDPPWPGRYDLPLSESSPGCSQTAR